MNLLIVLSSVLWPTLFVLAMLALLAALLSDGRNKTENRVFKARLALLNDVSNINLPTVEFIKKLISFPLAVFKDEFVKNKFDSYLSVRINSNGDDFVTIFEAIDSLGEDGKEIKKIFFDICAGKGKTFWGLFYFHNAIAQYRLASFKLDRFKQLLDYFPWELKLEILQSAQDYLIVEKSLSHPSSSEFHERLDCEIEWIKQTTSNISKNEKS
jgi:hypothetical protein